MRTQVIFLLTLNILNSILWGNEITLQKSWEPESQAIIDLWKNGEQKDAEHQLSLTKSTNAELLFLKGLFERSRFDVEESNLLFSEVIKKYPKTWESLVATEIRSIDIMNTPEDSYLKLRSLSNEHPEDPLLNWIVGMMSREMSKNPKARVSLDNLEIVQIGIQHYRRLIKELPACSSLIAQSYANLLEEIGLWEEELVYRKIASEKEPSAWATSALGNTYWRLGDLEKAESTYRSCIRLYKNKTNSYYNLCRLLTEQKQFDEAYKMAQEFYDWSSVDEFALINLASVEFDLKHDKESMRAFQKYLEKTTGYSSLWIRYAYLLDRNKKWDEARQISKNYEQDKSKSLSKDLLFKKVEQGDVTAISSYLEKGGDPNVVDPKNSSQTLLIKAVYFGKTEIALKILDFNPNLNATDSNQCTALMYAAQHGRVLLFETLLEGGANAWLKNKWGETAGDIALSNQNYDSIAILIKKNPVAINKEAYKSMAYYAAGWGFTDFLRIFLDEGVPFLEVPMIPKNPKRQTALMNACAWGHITAIRLLVDRGADLNVIDKEGKTALHYLAAAKPIPNLELYQWMVAKGAKEEIKDLSGQTPRQIKLLSPAKLRLITEP